MLSGSGGGLAQEAGRALYNIHLYMESNYIRLHIEIVKCTCCGRHVPPLPTQMLSGSDSELARGADRGIYNIHLYMESNYIRLHIEMVQCTCFGRHVPPLPTQMLSGSGGELAQEAGRANAGHRRGVG